MRAAAGRLGDQHAEDERDADNVGMLSGELRSLTPYHYTHQRSRIFAVRNAAGLLTDQYQDTRIQREELCLQFLHKHLIYAPNTTEDYNVQCNI